MPVRIEFECIEENDDEWERDEMDQTDRLTKPLDAPARLVPSRTDHDWVAVDVETATPRRDSLCSIAAVRVKDGVILDSFQALVRPPGNEYNPFNTRVHGMGPESTDASPGFGSVSVQFWAY
ncbi:MAG: hypothetical protein AAGC46_14845, partial [Solirubrobacteraceae bacterium]|nr:hypothetical protein [Patulibacter sp.]